MKRSIVFRGYNLKNKKWLYGYYLVNRGKSYIVQDEVVNPFAEESDFEVDPESVGQLVAEVKGVELYEGDYIVHRHTTCDAFLETALERNAVIRYDHDLGLLLACYMNEDGEYNDEKCYLVIKDKTYNSSFGDIKYKEEYKVVGNEYEEKLKGSNPRG